MRRTSVRRWSARSQWGWAISKVTHDYVGHVATTLFAALNATTSEVIAQCKARHRYQKFLATPGILTMRCRSISTCICSSTTTRHTSIRGAGRVSPGICATTRIARQVERWIGLIRQQGYSEMFACSLRASEVIPSSTFSTSGRSYGPPQPIPFTRK
jgi:hypothetical protein